MKIKFLFPLIIFTLCFSSPVFAVETTSNSAVVTPKAVRTQIKEERKEIKANLSELKIKKIQALYNTIKASLTQRHEALTKIKNKLDARIAKNPMNKNTETAIAKLKEFDAAENQYKLDLAALEAKFSQITTSTNLKPDQVTSELKNLVNTVKKDLENIKKILTETTLALAKAPKLEVTKTQ